MRRTDSLGLFEYEVAKDGKQVFSIDQALNQNWEILDEKFETLCDQDKNVQNDLQKVSQKIDDKKFNVDYSKGQTISVSGYYCPADGIVTGVMTAAHSENYWVQVNGYNVQNIYGEQNQRVTGPFCIPVRQNDCITCIRLNSFKFFPYG